MKTMKLFLSIALIALTASTIGMNKENDNIEFENELVMENWMASPFEAMESELLLEEWMKSPFESTEADLMVEEWMTLPFKSAENELVLESWMITPFEATDDNCSEALIAAACN